MNHLQKQQIIRNFRYSEIVFRMFSCFLLHSVFIRTSKITQVVSCVRGGHRIMLVICKVLVFTKFYFYEPFYFYVNYFIWFCFCKNKQRMAFGANGMADQRIARDRLLSLEIRVRDFFLYVNPVSMK